MQKKVFSWVLIIFLLTGCAAPSAYKQVFEDNTTYNSKEFDVSKDTLHTAVIKAFLEKKFTISSEDEQKGNIQAERAFQKSKRSFTVTVQGKIAPCSNGNSKLYLNAKETVERLYVSDRTRFLLWIIPLPGGGGKQASKVIEREKLIEDEGFYKNFFDIVESNLKI